VSESAEPIAGELTVVNPRDNAILVLREANEDTLASLIADLRDLDQQVRHTKRMVAQEIHRRMDAQAEWTLIGEHWKISSRSPAPRETYDAEQLRHLLMQWAGAADSQIARGRLRAVEKAVTSKTEWIVRQAGINALKKLGDPVVDAALARTLVEEDASRPIKIELQ